MKELVILDLCAGSGSWSGPYREAGYTVIMVDLKAGSDVRLYEYPGYAVRGVLAAPPCTCFARSGARWPRTGAQLAEALSVVDACLRVVIAVRPEWWALENPEGKLRKFLGAPAYTIQPYEYGDPYTKKTLLWGKFNLPMKTCCYPTEGSKIQSKLGSRQERESGARSKTPEGFARAFFKANP